MTERGGFVGGERGPRGDAYLAGPARTHVAVPFTLDELWFLQNLVRQHDKQGLVWDRADMRQVHRGILALSALPPDRQANATYDLECDEGFLWLIEQQVPMTLMLGSDFIGRRILTRVFAALQQLEDGARPPLAAEVEELLGRLEGGDTRGSTG